MKTLQYCSQNKIPSVHCQEAKLNVENNLISVIYSALNVLGNFLSMSQTLSSSFGASLLVQR